MSFSSFAYPFYFLSPFHTLKLVWQPFKLGSLNLVYNIMYSKLLFCEIENKDHCSCLLFFPLCIFSGPVFWLASFVFVSLLTREPIIEAMQQGSDSSSKHFIQPLAARLRNCVSGSLFFYRKYRKNESSIPDL